MSRDKNRGDNEPELYPSEYIDFTPSSKKSKANIKLYLILPLIIVLAVSLFVTIDRIEFKKTANFSESIINANEIIIELKEYDRELKKLIDKNPTEFSEQDLITIIIIDIEFEKAENEIYKIKNDLVDRQHYNLNKEDLKKLIIFDADLKKIEHTLQETKVRIYNSPKFRNFIYKTQ